MVNKNYILLAGLCSAMALQPAFAQESASWSNRDMTYRGHSYDALDSAYIPESRMEQHREYLDYKYAFPAKPRNMWELGLNIGMVTMWGDVTSKNPFNAAKPFDAVGFGVSLRKAFGYTFSWRLNYNYMSAAGFDHRERAALEKPWTTTHAGQNIFSNYKFTGHELTLQLVGAVNNIKFHRAKNTLSLHGFIGAGAIAHKTMIANTSGGSNLDFSSMLSETDSDKRKDLYKDMLKDADYDYQVEDPSLPAGQKGGVLGDLLLDPVLVGGVGVQFKLGKRVSLQIENKITWTGLDFLDGVRMDPTSGAGLSSDKDILNYTSVGLGFNLGDANRSVQPLWWVNPMDHIYEELATPRHMVLPPVVLPDTDGDGVTDQFDKCPDTPAGVAVDAHGCPIDTDGDGVPDYKDKELITPTYCQPVDADGVGNCPCPEGCEGQTTCANIMPGSVSFGKNSASLSGEAKAQLSMLASQMNVSPTCPVVVEANGMGAKVQQQRDWDRVNAVINYLADELQISRDRLIFKYNTGFGDANSVRFRPAMEGETSGDTAPPHPHLSTGK